MTPLAGAPRRTRRWPWIVFALVLAVPVIEIATIISVGKVIGAWPTVALLVAESLLGAWLVKREGVRTWSALQGALSAGRAPSRELADASLVLVGGTLLLTPGFLSDVLGFFLLAPPTRPLARRLLQAVIARRLLGAGSGPHVPPGGNKTSPPPGSGEGDVIEGELL